LCAFIVCVVILYGVRTRRFFKLCDCGLCILKTNESGACLETCKNSL
jgi:hypothetical protein